MPSHEQFIVKISSVVHKKMGLKELARQLGFIKVIETHREEWKSQQGNGRRRKLKYNLEKEEQKGKYYYRSKIHWKSHSLLKN